MMISAAASAVRSITFENISKVYSNGTRALESVSFSIAPQTIHALCGENGAGKSTLMKLLFGLEGPTSGRILIGGQEVRINSPIAAAAHGIGMVHQHFSLLPSMTVAENISLGKEPRNGLLFDRQKAAERVVELSERYGLNVNPNAIVRDLSIAARQKVEILKALSGDVSILILDEPTAVLTPLETDELFERLHVLRSEGLTVIFISHRLREVRALSEHVTVLRGGRVALDSQLAGVTDSEVTSAVMGRQVNATARRTKSEFGKSMLEFRGVAVKTSDPSETLNDFNLTVRSGEIVGIAGVDGSGQLGIAGLLAGRLTPNAGQVLFGELDVSGASMADLRRAGLAHLPADRFADGGAGTMSLAENITAEAKGIYRGPFIRLGYRRARTNALLQEYTVKYLATSEPLNALSGGNAQKVVAAREFAMQPTILVADQPTRGIDAGATALIHERLRKFADAGVAVLLISADLDEILALSDKIVTLFAARATATLVNDETVTRERLGPYMLGLQALEK